VVHGEGKPLKVNGLAKVEVMMWLRKMTPQKSPLLVIQPPLPKEIVGLTPSPEKAEMYETNSSVK
jgi:hypothetical protein